MLNETDLRKPTFTQGRSIELADGQSWTFPQVQTKFWPAFANGKVVVGGGPTFGPEFDAGRDVLLDENADAMERFRVKFEMAVRLLQKNYELTDDQAAALIVFEPADPRSADRWRALGDVVVGHTSQATTAGTSA